MGEMSRNGWRAQYQMDVPKQTANPVVWLWCGPGWRLDPALFQSNDLRHREGKWFHFQTKHTRSASVRFHFAWKKIKLAPSFPIFSLHPRDINTGNLGSAQAQWRQNLAKALQELLWEDPRLLAKVCTNSLGISLWEGVLKRKIKKKHSQKR